MATPDEQYGVTDLIQRLIGVITHDVGGFKRNTFTSYQILKQSTDHLAEIKRLIRLADSDQGSWEDYDKYTEAIDPLEQALFNIIDITGVESALWLFKDEHTVSGLVSYINTWENHRRDLRQRLESLPASPQATFPLQSLYRHDDNYFLSSICGDIGAYSYVDPADRHGRISNTKKVASIITSKSSKNEDDTTLCLAVKCTMAVHGVFEIATGTSDAALKQKISSSNVWREAESLLGELASHLERKTNHSQLQAKYTKFITLLQSLPAAELPAEYLRLKKLVKDVRRHYLSQTLVIVSQCRTLAEYFANNKSSDNLEPLAPAISEAVNTINTVVTSVQNLKFEDGLPAADSKVTAAFDSATKKIEQCYNEYGLKTWAAEDAKMNKAKTQDEARMNQAKAKLGNRQVATTSSDTVTVIVKNGTNAPGSYKLDKNTYLSEVMWKESLKNPQILQGWLLIGEDRKPVRLDQKLESIVKSGDKCTLSFTIPTK